MLMAARNGRPKADEFGDFQTPGNLAAQVCRLLSDRGETPAAVVEPTCGIGNFLLAAFEQFTTLTAGVGIDINSTSIATVKHSLQTRSYGNACRSSSKVFSMWTGSTSCANLPEPILVVGNPPWITNADLGALGSTNLPQKTNFQNHNGLDAITGKSNFDISEWMLIKLLERLAGRNATLAMLCKTAVVQGSRACMEERDRLLWC